VALVARLVEGGQVRQQAQVALAQRLAASGDPIFAAVLGQQVARVTIEGVAIRGRAAGLEGTALGSLEGLHVYTDMQTDCRGARARRSPWR
jgi:hypothetical protein